MQIPCLALAIKRQAAVKAWAPAREPPGPQLFGEEVAIRVIDLGDVEVEKRAAQGDGVPKECHDGGRPDQNCCCILPTPGLRREKPGRSVVLCTDFTGHS